LNLNDDLGGQRLGERPVQEGDHAMKHRVKARRAKCKFGMAIALTFHSLRIFADELPTLPSPTDWWVLVEPAFMRPAVAMKVQGSERSMFAAAYTDGCSLELLPDETFKALDVEWQVFREQAAKNAAAFLRSLKPEIHRDADGIVEYVALLSDRPLAAACAITPAFQEMFSDILGPEFLAIIPNRYLVYAFPKLATDFQDYAPMVIRAYKATPYPVSLEVFEMGRDEIKAIGVFQEP
jgi:hypothetical protein